MIVTWNGCLVNLWFCVITYASGYMSAVFATAVVRG